MPKQPGPDDFEFLLMQDVAGYFSSIDPTIAPVKFLMRGSQNIYKDPNGNIANRFGRKQITGEAVDGTIAPVNSEYVWNTSLGATRMVRFCNGKFQVFSDVVTAGTGVWYDLLTSLTKVRGVFDTIWDNTLKKDELIFVKGDTNLHKWGGGIGLFASGTVNTIVLTSDAALAGFETSGGSVLINGNTYTYSGITTTTLTGVNVDSSTEPANSVVLQTVTTSANTPAADFTNDFIKVIGNRLHVGSYTSRLIYISSNSSYTNFTVPATRISGDPELITLDDNGKGIGIRGSSLTGNAHIFSGLDKLSIITYDQITVGTTLTEQTKVDSRSIGVLSSALAHEFIDSMGDTLVWLSQDQQVRTYGTFRNLINPASPTLSREVSTEFAATDFTNGHLKMISSGERGDIIYITAPNSGKLFLHQTKTRIDAMGNVLAERLWQPPFVLGISRVDVYKGDIIGFSNSNPQTYSIWDTGQWHDDSPSGNIPFTSIELLSYQSHGRRQGKFKFDKVYYEGYMSPATVLNGAIYFDYQGDTSLLNTIIHDAVNSPAKSQSFFTGSAPPSLGDASLGDNPLGTPTDVIGIGSTDVTDHDLLPKFRIISGVQLTDCFEYAIMIYSQDLDSRWEIIAIGANPTESVNQGVEIIK